MNPDKSNELAMITSKKVIKRAFWKLGCSGALFFTLNREFGFPMENEERATAPLCGGFMQTGNQCGMLWGAALGMGAESYRRTTDMHQAIGLAIAGTQKIMNSYSARVKSYNCREVTACDPSRVSGLVKYFLLGKPLFCMNLGVKWAPEAVQSASEGLSSEYLEVSPGCLSCASELAKKMGANDEEKTLVAGFAGGLGLSGNACGALAAAIWMKTLFRCKNGESVTTNAEAKKTMTAFYAETKDEIACHKITGLHFDSLEDHTGFLKDGGCAKLLEVIAQS